MRAIRIMIFFSLSICNWWLWNTWNF